MRGVSECRRRKRHKMTQSSPSKVHRGLSVPSQGLARLAFAYRSRTWLSNTDDKHGMRWISSSNSSFQGLRSGESAAKLRNSELEMCGFCGHALNENERQLQSCTRETSFLPHMQIGAGEHSSRQCLHFHIPNEFADDSSCAFCWL